MNIETPRPQLYRRQIVRTKDSLSPKTDMPIIFKLVETPTQRHLSIERNKSDVKARCRCQVGCCHTVDDACREHNVDCDDFPKALCDYARTVASNVMMSLILSNVSDRGRRR